MITAKAKWVEGMQFVGRAPSGHAIILDTTESVGGTDSGVRPMELLLVSLAGCTGMDVISILRKMRISFVDFEVEVHSEKSKEYPKIYEQIELVYRITGDVPEDKLEKAINLSQERYCGVSAMLGKATTLTHRYEINRPKEQEAEV